MPTVAHLYDSYDIAAQVSDALEAAGFGHEDVSVLANQGSLPLAMSPVGPTTGSASTPIVDGKAGTGAGTGASLGTLLGGGAGLLAGIGALAIPGVGPVVAAGWLVATLTGAGAGAGIGGLLGALTGSGVEDEDAHVYAEGVRRGGTLVTVRTDDARVIDAEAIMQRFTPVDVADRAASYRADNGWTGFDENQSVLSTEELRAEQSRVNRYPV